MSNEFDWLKDHLDKIGSKQDDMNVVLIENTTSLKEHMRRTELIEGELKLIRSRVNLMDGAAKAVSIAIAGALAAHSLGLF